MPTSRPRSSAPKPKASKADILTILRGRFLNEWASLSDLNRVLREKGMAAVKETDLHLLGVPSRRSYGKVRDPQRRTWLRGTAQNGAKVKAIVVGATPEAVNDAWRFADER